MRAPGLIASLLLTLSWGARAQPDRSDESPVAKQDTVVSKQDQVVSKQDQVVSKQDQEERGDAPSDAPSPSPVSLESRASLSLQRTREATLLTHLRLTDTTAISLGTQLAEPLTGQARVVLLAGLSTEALGLSWDAQAALDPPQQGAWRTAGQLSLSRTAAPLSLGLTLEALQASAQPFSLTRLGAALDTSLALTPWLDLALRPAFGLVSASLPPPSARSRGPLQLPWQPLGRRMDVWPARASVELGPRLHSETLSLALHAQATLGPTDDSRALGGSLEASLTTLRVSPGVAMWVARLADSGAWIGQLSLSILLTP
ncbi:MAG: hypothetical protein JST92_18745 [Deltaproteobacteria bacterium]|nr:hypothetical protein [Deltaproteobacteria bacterium]